MISKVLNILLEPSTNHILAYLYTNLRLSSKFLVPCTLAYHYTNFHFLPSSLQITILRKASLCSQTIWFVFSPKGMY